MSYWILSLITQATIGLIWVGRGPIEAIAPITSDSGDGQRMHSDKMTPYGLRSYRTPSITKGKDLSETLKRRNWKRW